MKRGTEEKEILWIKGGGGTFRITQAGKHRIIKPNQKFHAKPSEIPKGFRDTIKPLEKLVEAKNTVIVTGSKYTIKHRSGGWYDVVDSLGKKVNEKALKKPDVEALLVSLE